MKNILAIISVLILGMLVYFRNFHESPHQSKNPQEQSESQHIPIPAKASNSHDRFKDNIQIDRFKMLEHQQTIDQLNKKSTALIAKAELYIKNHPASPKKQLSDEERTKREAYEKKITNKINRLKELSNGH